MPQQRWQALSTTSNLSGGDLFENYRLYNRTPTVQTTNLDPSSRRSYSLTSLVVSRQTQSLPSLIDSSSNLPLFPLLLDLARPTVQTDSPKIHSFSASKRSYLLQWSSLDDYFPGSRSLFTWLNRNSSLKSQLVLALLVPEPHTPLRLACLLSTAEVELAANVQKATYPSPFPSLLPSLLPLSLLPLPTNTSLRRHQLPLLSIFIMKRTCRRTRGIGLSTS